jgi:hypothetical protein
LSEPESPTRDRVKGGRGGKAATASKSASASDASGVALRLGTKGNRCTGSVSFVVVQRDRWLSWLAVAVGLALIVVAVVYWAEPAKSLPSWLPGHEAGSNHHHVKHGIAAFLLGLASLVFAWFRSARPPARAAGV